MRCARAEGWFARPRRACYDARSKRQRLNSQRVPAEGFSLKLSEVMTEQVQLTRLPNGLTVLTERMPGLRSATVGIWVRRGSRHEPEDWNGEM